jgi:hypothetical protein
MGGPTGNATVPPHRQVGRELGRMAYRADDLDHADLPTRVVPRVFPVAAPAVVHLAEVKPLGEAHGERVANLDALGLLRLAVPAGASLGTDGGGAGHAAQMPILEPR